VTTRRCTRPEAADEKRQWCDSQCCPAEDAEAVHVSEQMRLVTKLAIKIRYSSRVSISGGDTALRQKAGQGAHTLLQESGCLGKRRAHDRLVIIEATLACCGDEGDAEAAAPIAEEIGKAGGTIVLLGAQL
jgi:hypothetical protein